MKLTLAVLSLICCGCFAQPVEKRSISDGWSSYGLSSAAIATPTFSIGAPTISSHTHTHSTAIVDRPVAVPIHTTSYLPSISSASILPSYNYGLSSYNFGYPSYGSFGYGSDFGRYYAKTIPSTTVYKKSFYSSPLKAKWW